MTTITSKELRIAVAVTLPADLFEQAQLTGRVQEVLKGLDAALRGVVGAAPFKVDTRVVSVSIRPRASAIRGEVDQSGQRSEEVHSTPF